MTVSRRECSLMLLPALLRAQAPAPALLPSKTYRLEDQPARTNGAISIHRSILAGKTHEGYQLEMHQTQLAAGASPHPPHRHAHEEAFFMKEGTLEVTINGNTTTVGAGGVVYVASNEEHGVKNIGTTPAQYFVVEIGTRAPVPAR